MAVLYTTHYMEEAERLCDRIGILDHGRTIAEGTRRSLVAQTGENDRLVVRASGDLDPFVRRLGELPEVLTATATDQIVDVQVSDATAALAGVVHAADHDGVQIADIQVREPDLESVFLHLTGRALRD
jgi:ABC-2 type transport system ATP-binding protein